MTAGYITIALSQTLSETVEDAISRGLEMRFPGALVVLKCEPVAIVEQHPVQRPFTAADYQAMREEQMRQQLERAEEANEWMSDAIKREYQ